MYTHPRTLIERVILSGCLAVLQVVCVYMRESCCNGWKWQRLIINGSSMTCYATVSVRFSEMNQIHFATMTKHLCQPVCTHWETLFPQHSGKTQMDSLLTWLTVGVIGPRMILDSLSSVSSSAYSGLEKILYKKSGWCEFTNLELPCDWLQLWLWFKLSDFGHFSTFS